MISHYQFSHQDPQSGEPKLKVEVPNDQDSGESFNVLKNSRVYGGDSPPPVTIEIYGVDILPPVIIENGVPMEVATKLLVYQVRSMSRIMSCR